MKDRAEQSSAPDQAGKQLHLPSTQRPFIAQSRAVMHRFPGSMRAVTAPSDAVCSIDELLLLLVSLPVADVQKEADSHSCSEATIATSDCSRIICVRVPATRAAAVIPPPAPAAPPLLPCLRACTLREAQAGSSISAAMRFIAAVLRH